MLVKSAALGGEPTLRSAVTPTSLPHRTCQDPTCPQYPPALRAPHPAPSNKHTNHQTTPAHSSVPLAHHQHRPPSPHPLRHTLYSAQSGRLCKSCRLAHALCTPLQHTLQPYICSCLHKGLLSGMKPGLQPCRLTAAAASKPSPHHLHVYGAEPVTATVPAGTRRGSKQR